MAKCSFCDRNIEQGTGVMVVRTDGKVYRFDSKKCEKAMLKLKRDSRKVKWIIKKQ